MTTRAEWDALNAKSRQLADEAFVAQYLRCAMAPASIWHYTGLTIDGVTYSTEPRQTEQRKG